MAFLYFLSHYVSTPLDLSFFLLRNEKERTRKEVQLMLTFENQNVEFNMHGKTAVLQEKKLRI